MNSLINIINLCIGGGLIPSNIQRNILIPSISLLIALFQFQFLHTPKGGGGNSMIIRFFILCYLRIMFAAKKSLGEGPSPMLRTWIDIEQNGEKIQDEK